MKLNKLILSAVIVALLSSPSFAAKQNTYTTKTAPVSGDKALIADSADANKTKQAALSFALVGDCTGFPCLDGSTDGGNMIKLWAGTGSYWTALQGGAPAANRSWRLPIAAPPPAGSTLVMTMDEYGQMGFLSAPGTSGYVLSSTDAGVLSWAAGGSGSVSDTAYGAGWNGDTTTAPSKNAVYDKIETLAGGHDAVTLGTDADVIFGLSAQQITLDSQTANYVFAAPNGSPGDPTFRALVAADIPTLNQNTTGSAATLTTARTIGGVSFNGSANINLPGVNTAGNQNTSGTAAGLTAQYIDWNSASGGSSIANKPTIPTAGTQISFTPNGSIAATNVQAAIQEVRDEAGSGSMVYPGAGVPNSTGSAWGTSYTVGTGASNLVQLNASSQLPAVSAALLTNFPTLNQNTTGSAATLTTARTIGGVSFNGSANINLPGVNTSGNQNTSGTAAGLSGTPNITVGTISAGATGFSVDADGDVTAKSITVTRTTSPTALRFYEGTGGGDNYIDLTLSGNLSGDSTVNLDQLVTTASFDDTPDNGSTTTAPTSNWAYDHAAATATHGISGAIVGTSDSATLTNKTIDVEDTGNAITIVDKIWFAAAGCNNTTAASFYDLPTSNPAAAACITGTNTQKGVLDFDAGTDESGQVSLMLPADAAELTSGGGVDITLKWLAAATSGSVVWGVQTSCVADAETDDPSWNTASTVTDAAKGTTLQTNDATIGDVTMTGCAAGELLHLRIFRDADNGSDDMTGDARLIGAEVTIRRAQ